MEVRRPGSSRNLPHSRFTSFPDKSGQAFPFGGIYDYPLLLPAQTIRQEEGAFCPARVTLRDVNRRKETMIWLRSLAIVALLATLGILIGIAQPKPSAQAIGLERTMCFGTCPAYKVMLYPDGTLTYEGIAHVSRMGKYKATFWSSEFDRLAQLMDKLGLRKLKDRYAAPMTDQPSAITTMKVGGKAKVIDDYGHAGPVELWGFNAAIDGIVANAKGWEKIK